MRYILLVFVFWIVVNKKTGDCQQNKWVTALEGALCTVGFISVSELRSIFERIIHTSWQGPALLHICIICMLDLICAFHPKHLWKNNLQCNGVVESGLCLSQINNEKMVWTATSFKNHGDTLPPSGPLDKSPSWLQTVSRSSFMRKESYQDCI